MDIKEFILKEIQQEYSIEKNEDIDRLNYVEKGYVDSIGIIQFIVTIEDKFNIQFSDEEISSEEFKIVGKLIKIIERKVRENEKS